MCCVLRGMTPAQLALLSLSAVMKARVKNLRPLALLTVGKFGVGKAHTSTYGAMFFAPQEPRLSRLGSFPTSGRICLYVSFSGSVSFPPKPIVFVVFAGIFWFQSFGWKVHFVPLRVTSPSDIQVNSSFAGKTNVALHCRTS
ncbi:hypothetical protein FR483_n780L [Paramecium bursaria Chlorella virus FR483]|uniref:Uncharacterized protein n780L n=1 Tax=Paramecium bursaria Chlorella virus FR483 TaxID=399781 RepID=A7J8D4_PBCVF|nr:hypothetical protein FR483_n780L [Paramecium bursaria Chlorella virus FR483]ABT16065.1 hypothetical protein FR483_n780L [Paramecium bursaria Chlorella virus FR483]